MTTRWICKPALTYLIIALVMLCATVIIRLSIFDIASTFTQLSTILVCTLILMGLCSFLPELAWIFTIIFIIFSIISIVAVLLNTFSPAAP
jgi:hypothetical protein